MSVLAVTLFPGQGVLRRARVLTRGRKQKNGPRRATVSAAGPVCTPLYLPACVHKTNSKFTGLATISATRLKTQKKMREPHRNFLEPKQRFR